MAGPTIDLEAQVTACRTVRTWITQNVLVPVLSFLTGLREVCEEFRQSYEEHISRPVESFVSSVERRCRELPWWNPLRWFCELVTIVIKVVTWVVETVIKWVVTIVCQIVTFIIDIVVTLVLRVLAWLVSFVVCLFSEPDEALKSFRDLWMIVVDTVEEVIDFAVLLLDDVIGILNDLERLVDSLADSLGWLGVILGLIKGVIGFIRDVVDIVKDIIEAAKNVVVGLLGLNLCRMVRGITEVGTALGRALLVTGFVVLFPIRAAGYLVGGVRDQVDRVRLEGIITDAINNAFGAGSERAARAIDAVGIGASPMGLTFTVDARRLFLNSESTAVDLRALHNAGTIDLHRFAGYFSDCGEAINEAEGEVVYAGSRLTVSYADLETYLAEGPGSVPPFQVFAITRARFQNHLLTARRKAAALGVHLAFPTIGELEATSPTHVPLASTDNVPDGTAQRALLTTMGRVGAGDPLAVIPAINHFHYVLNLRGREIFGLASRILASPVVRPARDGDSNPTGVTYRNRTPDWGFRWVLVHEIGHYLGLEHDPGGVQRGLDEIMFSPASGTTITGSAVLEFGLLSGEPRFTLDDARTTWQTWITTVAADSVLP